MTTTVVVVLALLFDRWVGEPRRWHPLVGFGVAAKKFEYLLLSAGDTVFRQYLSGLLGVVLLTVPCVAIAVAVSQSSTIGTVFSLLLLYLSLGGRSLRDHAAAVSAALRSNNLVLARERVGMMVSRDTQQLDEPAVVKATVESVLENGCDALFGALFWFVVAGAPGVVFYRLVNTLDAMWGYKSDRYRYFGWAAARLDDLLNLIPARLTALTYVCVGGVQPALRCWFEQGRNWESPNAGPVMAAGAGALMVQLGGAAQYGGKIHPRPLLGSGRLPVVSDIGRATRLLQRGVWLWVFAIAAGGWIFV